MQNYKTNYSNSLKVAKFSLKPGNPVDNAEIRSWAKYVYENNTFYLKKNLFYGI